MNQPDSKSLFESAGPRYGDQTPFCVANDEIAAYIDGKLQPDDHQRVERHLTDCDVCTDRVGQAVRLLRDADDSARPSDEAMARAQRLSNRSSSRHAPRWAAAAALVLAIFVVSDRMSEVENGAGMDPRSTRNVGATAMTLQLRSPEPGVIVNMDELVFRWHAVDDSLYYDIRIVTGSGGLVTEQRVQHTEWKLSDDIELSPETDYFVRIDAFLPDARTISSYHVRFRVSGRK